MSSNISVIYEEVSLSDLVFVKEEKYFTYPCPCGDEFTFFVEDLENGDFISTCPSCSLNIKLNVKEGELAQFLSSSA